MSLSFEKPCRMSLSPKKVHVAVPNLGVYSRPRAIIVGGGIGGVTCLGLGWKRRRGSSFKVKFSNSIGIQLEQNMR